MTIAPVKDRTKSNAKTTALVQEKHNRLKGDRLFFFRSSPAAVRFCSTLDAPVGKAALVILSVTRFFQKHMGKARPLCFLGVDFLRTFINPQVVSPALRALRASGLLDSTGQYIIGKRCRAYSLGAVLKNEDWFATNVNNLIKCSPAVDPWKKFIAHIKKRPEFAHLLEEEKEVMESQLKCLKTLSVKKSPAFSQTIESESKRIFKKAQKEFKKDYDKVIKHNRKAAKKGKPLKLVPQFNITMKGCREIISERINSIDQKNWQVSVHSRSRPKGTGRIFTNVTNCPKAFRKFLRIDGEKTVNVDIRCAQPSLLALFYDPATQEDQEERRKFVENITDKDFYSEMAANSPDSLTRDVLKIKTFSFIFGRNEHQNTKIGRTFQATYPILHKRITELKDKEGYKECAYRMQCAEVDAVIYGAFKELDSKGIVAITIHDSITCKESDAAKVQEALERHFEKKMGFKPFVRTDRYEDVED